MNKLMLNTEYTYKQICEILGIKYYTGNSNSKIKQIKAIESAYEFYHPINKKTHKEKKSYIFTKQLCEIDFSDQRKNNGGFSKYDEFFQPLLLHIHNGEYTITQLFEKVFGYQWDKKYIEYWKYRPSADRKASKNQTEIVKYTYNMFKSNLMSQLKKLDKNDDYTFWCEKGYRLWNSTNYNAFNEGLSVFHDRVKIIIYDEENNCNINKKINSLDIELYEQEIKEKYMLEKEIDKLSNKQREELFKIQHDTNNVKKIFGYDNYCVIFKIDNKEKAKYDFEYYEDYTYFRQNLKLQFLENIKRYVNTYCYRMYDYKRKRHIDKLYFKYRDDKLVIGLLKEMEGQEETKTKSFGRREPKITAFVVDPNFADDAIMYEPE